MGRLQRFPEEVEQGYLGRLRVLLTLLSSEVLAAVAASPGWIRANWTRSAPFEKAWFSRANSEDPALQSNNANLSFLAQAGPKRPCAA